MLLEPMLSFMTGMKLFFRMGSETFSSDNKIDHFLNKTSNNVCRFFLILF